MAAQDLGVAQALEALFKRHPHSFLDHEEEVFLPAKFIPDLLGYIVDESPRAHSWIRKYLSAHRLITPGQFLEACQAYRRCRELPVHEDDNDAEKEGKVSKNSTRRSTINNDKS